MHSDLALAAVAAVLIFIVLWIFEKTGIARYREKGRMHGTGGFSLPSYG